MRENLPSIAECVTCNGAKTFRYYNLETGSDEIVEYDCPCKDQWIANRFFSYNGVALAHQRISWRDLRPSETDERILLEYVVNLDHALRSGMGLYLFGKYGTGKTSVGVLILKEALAQGYPGHFTSFMDLKDTYTQSYSGGEEDREWYRKKIRETQLLVIDDPGKQSADSQKGFEYSRTVLDDVLRHRMADDLPTIITSNLPLGEFGEGYGDRLRSLVTEKMLFHEMSGTDFRPEHALGVQRLEKLRLTKPIVVR
jgi:DNA replication protein DnaC